jgi:hypothetical protein
MSTTFVYRIITGVLVPIAVALITAGYLRGCSHTGTWTEIPLTGPWTQNVSFEPVAVMKDSLGIVHIRGSATHTGPIAHDSLGPLPVEFRPENTVEGAIVAGGEGAYGPACAISIDKFGKIEFSGCGSAVYMDGFSFPAKGTVVTP